MEGEAEGLGEVVHIALGSRPNDDNLLMVSHKGPSLSDASSCCCAKMQLQTTVLLKSKKLWHCVEGLVKGVYERRAIAGEHFGELEKQNVNLECAFGTVTGRMV